MSRKTHVRYRHCDARRVLKQPLSWYIRVPSCKACGHYDRERTYRVVKDKRTPTCYCDTYHFPHHKWYGNCYGPA